MFIPALIIWVLLMIVFVLILQLTRSRNEYSQLEAIWRNGYGDLGEHSSLQDWEDFAQASLDASRKRRKNGKRQVA